MNPEIFTVNEEASKASKYIANGKPIIWNRILVLIGIIIFGFTLCTAYNITQDSMNFTKKTLLENDKKFEQLINTIKKINKANPNTIAYLARSIEAEVNLKSLANKQTAILTAMVFGFGLIAIGFALFVMGIESTYDIKLESTDNAILNISATAPGLLCFILATVLICFSLYTAKSTIEFGPFIPVEKINNTKLPEDAKNVIHQAIDKLQNNQIKS